MIRDIGLAEYLQRRGLEQSVTAVTFDGCPSPIHLLRLARGWIEVPLWMPIADDGFTFADFSQIYVRAKYGHIYTEAFAAAMRAADAPPLRDVFILGGEPNHFHFLMDFLPRLFFVALRPEFARLPIAIADSLSERQRDLSARIVRRLTGRAPMLVPLPPGVHAVENALVPGVISREAAVLLWSRYLWSADRSRPPGPERLFVSRRGAAKRRLINEDEVAARLGAMGFVRADPGELSFDDQVALFANARLIVGVHGAALTNLLFAPRGATVLELHGGVPQPFFADIAAAKGMRHHALAGTPASDRHGHNEDFSLPADAVIEALRDLGPTR